MEYNITSQSAKASGTQPFEAPLTPRCQLCYDDIEYNPLEQVFHYPPYMSGKTSLYARLLGIESEFLFAISGDDASLESFRVIWVALQQDIQSAQIAGTLKQDVVELAFSVSTRIRIISEAFQELEETVQQLSNELDQELDRLYEGSLSSQGDSSSDDNIGNAFVLGSPTSYSYIKTRNFSYCPVYSRSVYMVAGQLT